MPHERAHHLPRLSPEAYRGHCIVHWTMTIAGRATGWLDDSWHQKFRIQLNKQATDYDARIPVYCLMPDHLHLLVAGIATTCDQSLFIRAARREINLLLRPHKLQKQPYDHVLRPSESGPDVFTTLVHYIAENPVRAGLVSTPQLWHFTGACVPELPTLDPRASDFRELWWEYWNKRVNQQGKRTSSGSRT